MSDFEGPLLPTDRVIKGVGGSRTRNVMMGTTLKWQWEDDQGMAFTFRMPNSYYVPEGNIRLLSPQHWARQHQHMKSKHRQATKPAVPKHGRCGCEDDRKCGETIDIATCVLFWNNGANKRTIRLGSNNNVATFALAPGYNGFHAFCSETNIADEHMNDVVAMPSGIISDDEDDDAPVPEHNPPPSPNHHLEPPPGGN